MGFREANLTQCDFEYTTRLKQTIIKIECHFIIIHSFYVILCIMLHTKRMNDIVEFLCFCDMFTQLTKLFFQIQSFTGSILYKSNFKFQYLTQFQRSLVSLVWTYSIHEDFLLLTEYKKYSNLTAALTLHVQCSICGVIKCSNEDLCAAIDTVTTVSTPYSKAIQQFKKKHCHDRKITGNSKGLYHFLFTSFSFLK